MLKVVANPAAGKQEPVLAGLNEALAGSGMRWDVDVTLEAGDATRLARDAAEAGADVVAAYGGDGTVREVVEGLIGTGVPMAILPGGTGNALSYDLGIPEDLRQAAALLAGPHSMRALDVAETDRGRFVLRAAIGLEAEMVLGASRQLKDRLGDFAYVLSALRGLAEPPVARYRLTIDGAVHEAEGITCAVANSGSLAMGDLSFAPGIRVDDGKLDVLVIRRGDLPGLAAFSAAVMRGTEPPPATFACWQARRVCVEADPPQPVVLDGEAAGETPLEARVLPGAVRVLVPVQSRGEPDASTSR